MPVFILLVFLAVALIWGLSATLLFIPFGKLWTRIWGNVMDTISRDEDESKNEENVK